VYVHLHAFIFPLILFWGGVVVGHSHHSVWLVALDAYWAISMDCLSYGRRYCCTQGVHRAGQCPCAHALLFVFPLPLVGAELRCVCVCMCVCVCVCDAVAGSCGYFHLPWRPAAELKLVQMEGHEKLGLGVT
jgi:hypothetical protein